MTKEFRPVPPRTVGRNGGRPKGAKNKVTVELMKVAGKYTEEAVKELHRIMLNSENDSARVAAARELLDRGHGKPTPSHSGPDAGLIMVKIVA